MASTLCFILTTIVFTSSVLSKECYWNRKCSYDLFGTVTPYESVRGDIRDLPKDSRCETLSIWSLHRHGARNPGADVTNDVRDLQVKIKSLLHHNIDSPSRRESNGCAQDMDDLINWSWNSTLDDSSSYLTGRGYEELYALGRRIFIGYQDFLRSIDNVYFRATNEQRTSTSVIAFVHGMTDGTGLNFSDSIEKPTGQDDVIRPYENCDLYQNDVRNGALLTDELAAYDSSAEFEAIRDKVQAKLFVYYQLTYTDVYTLYQMCRFDRSWNLYLRSPWCAFFTDEDLIVLEYRDDVRHYYRNGYGSAINAQLGAIALRDLYENFVNVTKGNQKSIFSYFTHDTMMDMVYCALGLYNDSEPLRGSTRKASRLWRTSQFAAFASNLIFVLSRCDESGNQVHRVQLLVNEKPTSICPEEGCTWQQFVDIFQVFSEANLEFCAQRSESGSAPFISGRSDTKIRLATNLIVLIFIMGIFR